MTPLRCSLLILMLACPAVGQANWPRHTIDNTSRGADGVRLADVNQDGLPDIATGWEEGGRTRVYLHPGYPQVRSTWPSVTVGRSPSVEDAVFCDLDSDRAVDVISCCEGRTKTIFVHWAPQRGDDYLTADRWSTQPIECTQGMTAWMFAVPLQVDGRNGVDLIVGSKGNNACVGWLQSPANPRDLNAWRFHRLYDAGWIMSLQLHDIDEDGDQDVVVSDRRGETSGVLWLENPSSAVPTTKWIVHRIGALKREVMFLDVARPTGDLPLEIVAAVRPREIHRFLRSDRSQSTWTAELVSLEQADRLGTAKSVALGDLDGDGQTDVAYGCEHAQPPKQGVVWFRRQPDSSGQPRWTRHDLSGPQGIKFDRLELLDLDGDHDLDLLTCEERHAGVGLGVIWYENPLPSAR